MIVRRLSGETFAVPLAKETTVADIKEQLATACGVPAHQLSLVRGSDILPSELRFSPTDLRADEELQLVASSVSAPYRWLPARADLAADVAADEALQPVLKFMLVPGGCEALAAARVLERCWGLDETTMKTTGVGFAQRRVQRHGRSLDVELWSNPSMLVTRRPSMGQIRAQSRALSGIACVYDTASQASFSVVAGLLREMHAMAERGEWALPAVLVGCCGEAECERQVPVGEARRLAEELDVALFEVPSSCGTGTEDALLHLVDLAMADRVTRRAVVQAANSRPAVAERSLSARVRHCRPW